MQRKAYRWVILFLIVFASAMLNFSNLIFASRPTEVMLQFNMDQAQLTAISSVGLLPGAFFSIWLGNLYDKHGAKGIRWITAALFLLAALCQVWRIFANSYAQVFIITFLGGTFFLPTQVLPAKVFGAWFPRSEMGIAMGSFGASSGLGISLAFALSSLFPTVTDAFIWIAIGYLAVLVCWVALIRMPETRRPAPEETMDSSVRTGGSAKAGDPITAVTSSDAAVTDKPASKVSVSAVLKSRDMWLVMICSGLAASGPFLLNSYMVNAFMAKGMAAASTSLLATLFNLGLTVGGVFWGIFASRSGRYNRLYAFIAFASAVALLTAYLIPVGIGTYLLITLGGLIVGGALGLNMARIALLPMTGDFGPENIGIAGGANNTALGIFMFLLPTGVAMFIGDDYMGLFIVLTIFLVLLGILGGFVIPELGEKGRLAQKTAEG